jgi:hypothetical protein
MAGARAVGTLGRWWCLALAGVVWSIAPGCGAAPERPTRPEPPTAAPAEDSSFVGVEACRSCHPGPWKVWLASRHARASVTLHTALAPAFAARLGRTGDGFAQDPICLGCHGVGLVDGRPPAWAEAGYQPSEGVTCEACHGPGGRHVEAASAKRTGSALVAGLRAEPRACLDCHQEMPSHAHERRIHYDPEKFSGMIRHGKEPPSPAAPASSGSGAPHPGGM